MPNTLAQLAAGTTPLLDIITIWHKDEIGNPRTYRFATDTIRTPVTFLGGRVDGCLLDVSSSRPNSDRQGGWQSGQMRAVLSDADFRFRRWMANSYQAKLKGAYIAHSVCTPAEVAAGTAPTRFMMGMIESGNILPDWQFEIVATDVITPRLDDLWPQSFINATNFPGCLASLVGQPEPIIFGVIDDNDPTYGGECPTIYLGTTKTISGDPTWIKVLVAGHRVTSIDAVWLNGVNVSSQVGVSVGILAPGYANWPEANNWVTIGGRDYTLLYVHDTVATGLAAGTSHLTLAITSIWSGDAPQQLAAFLDNYVFRAYLTGSPLTYADATYPDGSYKRANAEFTDASAESSTGVSFVLSQTRTLREILQGFAVCGDLSLTLNASGEFSCSYDQMVTLPGYIRTGHSDADLVRGSFRADQQPVENVIPYSYGPALVDGATAFGENLTVSDTTSIAAHGELRAQPIDFWMLRDASSVSTILDRRILRSKVPRYEGTFSVFGYHNLSGLFAARVGYPMTLSTRDAPGGGATWLDLAVADGATHIWRFSEQPEQALTTAKNAISAANGTYAGSPQLGIAGPWGDGTTGLWADGTNDEVTLASPIATTSTCTFEFWASFDNFNAGSGASYVIAMTASGTQAVRWINSSQKFDVLFGAANHANSSVLTYGAWYHVVISIAAGSGTYYINGGADGTFSGYTGYSVNRLLNAPAIAGWCKGGFKDVALYVGTALSAAQAAAHYARSKAINMAALGWSEKVIRSNGMTVDGRQKTVMHQFVEWAP
jgi:hypothetical protein